MSENDEIPNIRPNNTDRVIAKAIDESKAEASEDYIIRLSTGVVLKAKQANPSTLIRVMTKQQRPSPPLYFNKEMGREMENPDDPDYISRVQAWQMDYTNGMLNVLIGLGTELITIPDGMPRISDDSWLADYRALGLPVIADSPAWRYITWVMFVAAPTEKDLNIISQKVKTFSGVKEADVRNAENFPAGN